MIKFLKKFKVTKKTILSIVVLCLVSFLIGKFSLATNVSDPITQGVGLAIATVLSWIAWVFVMLFGLLLTLLVKILVNVAQFSNIINVDTVIQGWVIIRDLCNMFFILIILIIAFATILRVENFSAKKLLPKLLIMAILINFSKTIFGLLIDFSQVIMLTFVNGFAQYGPANLINMFQTNQILAMWAGADVNSWGIVVAIIAGVLALLITNIVVVVMIAVLVMRIIMLWIYTILSPLVFLGFALPALQKYTGKIWEDFTKQLVVGPVLAFFIWLALATVSSSASKIGIVTGVSDSTTKEICAGIGKFFCDTSFQTFLITIGLLMGGLMVAQSMGGAAGSIAGKGLDWAKKVAAAPVKGLALGGKTLAGYGVDKLHQKTGVDLNVARVWSGIQEKRAEIKSKRYGEGVTKAAEAMREGGRLRGALAMTGTPGSAWEQLTTKQGWGARFRGGIKSKEMGERITGKDGKGGLMQASEQVIKDIQNDQAYKDAEEAAVALTPPQIRAKEAEKLRLESEIKSKETELSTHKAAYKLAENSGDSIGMKRAKDAAEKVGRELEGKVNQHQEVEGILNKRQYSDWEIHKAQEFKENKDKVIMAEQQKIKTHKDTAMQYKPIMDFEAIAMQGALESAETKKIQHIEDREELSSMLRDAIKKRDKSRFNAIALKLAHDGNGNDGVLNNLGFSSDAAGAQEMVKAISNREYKDKNGKMVKSEHYMGYSEQDALALGMKFSYAEESVNHWGAARAFTMENGRYRNSTTEEQSMAAASEVAKMDPQGIARSLNRLGFGGETPDGKFVLGDYGVTLLKAIGPKLTDQLKRLNPNIAARLVLPENLDIMINAGISPDFINGLQSRTQGAGTVTVKAAIDDLRNQLRPDGTKRFSS